MNESESKPPAPGLAEEEAGEKGLGVETGASESGDEEVLEEMPEARGEVRYPDVEDPEGPPRTPQEGRVDPDAPDKTDATD